MIETLGSWNPEALSAVAVAFLTVLAAFLNSRQKETARRDLRELKAVADIRKDLPDDTGAVAELDTLLAFQAKRLREVMVRGLIRKINWPSVTAAIFVGLVGSGVTWGLLVWASSNMPLFWSILLDVVAAIVGLFTILLVGFGMGTDFFKYEDPEDAV